MTIIPALETRRQNYKFKDSLGLHSKLQASLLSHNEKYNELATHIHTLTHTDCFPQWSGRASGKEQGRNEESKC